MLLKSPLRGEKNVTIIWEFERSLLFSCILKSSCLWRGLFCRTQCFCVLKKMMCVLLCSFAKHLKAYKRVFSKCNCSQNSYIREEERSISSG